MKTALLKNTFREIKNTKARFVSIMMIVALGVGFFAGVKSTSPSMEKMAVDYYSDTNLMDFRLVSTLGFEEKDVTAIGETDGVKDVMPAYFLDVAVSSEETAGSTIRLLSSPAPYKEYNEISTPVVIEGRMPEKSGEIAVETSTFGTYKLGDKITILQNVGDTDVSDKLKTFDYTVVGVVKSPMYISIERGTTTVGNGKIDEFAYISEDDFNIERYTVVYTTLDTKGQQVSPFSNKYEKLVDTVTDNLEKTADLRVQAFYDENIAEAQKKIDDGYKELEEEKKKVNKELADAKAEIEKGEKQYNSEINSAQAQITTAEAQISSGKKELETKWEEYNKAVEFFESEISKAKEELANAQAQFDEAHAPVDKLIDSRTAIEDEVVKVASGPINGIVNFLPSSADPSVAQTLQAYAASVTYSNARDVLVEAKHYMNSIYGGWYDLTFNGAIVAVDVLYKSVDAINKQIDEAEAQFAPARAELENGYAQLETKEQEGQDELDGYKTELDKAQTELDTASSTLEKSRAEFSKAKTDGKNKLDNGRAEYEEGVKKAEKEFTQAGKELRDAQKKLDEVPRPEWFVFDREDNPGYSGFVDNTNRIDAVASVFPLFFLLVALLVCLTTMTRLVEEKRTEIGTLKALGYSDLSIISKFVTYACFASILGCVLGCVTCIPTLPRVIYNAYSMMYNMSSTIDIVIDKLSFVVAIVAALACCALVTLFVCYKSLRHKPASLMRPKAPKAGKRILMERITPLWKCFNFSQKVTWRNLFRYKSRLFMTVIGVAGCTALMLAAFGLYDSINDVVDLQYGELNRYNTIIVADKEKPIEEIQELKDAVDSDERFESSALISQKQVAVSHDDNSVNSDVYLMVTNNPEDLQKLVTLRNRETKEKLELTDKGVILTEKLAKKLSVSIDDDVVIGESGDTAKVIGIAENYVYNYIYMTDKAYTQMTGKEPLYSTIYTCATDLDSDTEKVIGSDYLKRDDTTAVSFTTTIINDFKDTISSMNIVVLVMIISAGALAIVVLYNLTNINLAERNREIATIKVLGFNYNETSAFVYRENIILTLLGMLSGLVLGVFLWSFVVTTVEVDTVMFGRQIHLLSYFYAFALTGAFALLVNFIMYFRIKAINMVESLKSIE